MPPTSPPPANDAPATPASAPAAAEWALPDTGRTTKAIAGCFAVSVALVWLVAGLSTGGIRQAALAPDRVVHIGRPQGGGEQQQPGLGEGGARAACHYGSLPGTWQTDGGAAWNGSTSPAPGARWRLLAPPPGCQLRNRLDEYRQAYSNINSKPVGASRSPGGGGGGGGNSSNSAAAAAAAPATGTTAAAAAAAPLPPRPARQTLPPVRILWLSDSVDRLMATYLCEHVGGAIDAVLAAGGPSRPPIRSNVTGYNIHVCDGVPGVRLAAAYFPGVHPDGPYHKNLTQSYRERMSHAAHVWRQYSPHGPPHVLALGSCFWDLARLYFHEPREVSGPLLSRRLVDDWTRNFTAVVDYAAQVFPHAALRVYRTSMPPRVDPQTEVGQRRYLGRRAYIEQLNAAGERRRRRRWHQNK